MKKKIMIHASLFQRKSINIYYPKINIFNHNHKLIFNNNYHLIISYNNLKSIFTRSFTSDSEYTPNHYDIDPILPVKKKTYKTPSYPKDIEKYCRNSSIYYLQQRTSSVGNLIDVLKRKLKKKSILSGKLYNETVIDDAINIVIAEHIKSGLLNDEIYSFNLASRLYNSGKSQKVIKMKLKLKRINDDMITNTLKKLFESNDSPDLTAAIVYAKKKKLGPYGTEKPIIMDDFDISKEARYLSKQQSMVEGNKLFAKFARGGFSFDICKRVLVMKKDEADEVLLK